MTSVPSSTSASQERRLLLTDAVLLETADQAVLYSEQDQEFDSLVEDVAAAYEEFSRS